MESKLLTIRNTRNGKGIFAKKNFKKDQIIYRIEGRKVSIKYAESKGGKFNANTFRFNKKLYISPEGKIGVFQNHSCNPNSYCKTMNHSLYVLAVKGISNRQEILIDYSTIIADDDEWSMVCNCGSNKCRKIVKKFSSLKKELQNRYKKMEIVPDYIIK